jgi:hypothetical protein
MLQDNSPFAAKLEQFVKTICETGLVYALESEEGLATSSSNELEYDDGEPVDLICFWSDKTLAESCLQDDWSDYKVIEISLPEIMEDWCVGMANDGLVVACNFDSDMVGWEIDPLELLMQLIEEIKATNSTIVFEKYESLEDMEQEVREAMEGGE